MRRVSKNKNNIYCESYQIIDDIDVLPFEDKEQIFKQTINSLTQENKRLKQLVHFKEHMLGTKQNNIINKNSDYHPKLGMENAQSNNHNGKQYEHSQVCAFQWKQTNAYVSGTMKSILRQLKKQLDETDSVKKLKPEHDSTKNIRTGTNADFVRQQSLRIFRVQYQNHEEVEREREIEHSVSQQTKTPQPSSKTLKQLIENHFHEIFKGKTEAQIESHCEKIIQEIEQQTTPKSSLHNFGINSSRVAASNINLQEQLDSRTSFNDKQTGKKSLKMLDSNKSENTIEMMNSHMNSSSSENLNLILNQEIAIQIKNFVELIKKNAFAKSQTKKSQQNSLNSKNSNTMLKQKQREDSQFSQSEECRQSSENYLKHKYSEGSQQGQIGDLKIQASLKKIEQSLKKCKTQVINDKQNQRFLPKQYNLQSNVQYKPRKESHFRGISYIESQPVQLKYDDDEVILRKCYNNSCLSAPSHEKSKFEQSQNRDISKRHPIQPNTEWNITPQNRVYTQKWKVIADNSMNPVPKRNNLIRNSPYV